MTAIDFDFPRYIERRKGLREAEAREGEAYAYPSDVKWLRTLDKIRPVTMALETAVKHWRGPARDELLADAQRVGPRHHPRLLALLEECAERLHVAAPSMYVAPRLPAGVRCWTLGSIDDATTLLHPELADGLAPEDLRFVLGRELGHAQNHHVAPLTALFFLRHSKGRFVRWVVRPATLAIEAWQRRAQVTSDRAGLLVLRDVDRAPTSLLRLLHGPAELDAATVEAVMALSRDGKAAVPTGNEILAAHPDLPRRIAALRAFADGAYYRGVIGQTGGYTQEACDDRVAEILSKGA